MKTTKLYFISAIILIFCLSCNFGNPENKNTIQYNLKFNNIYDHENGLAICQIPLPKNWKYNSKKNAKITVSGPNNIIVNKTETYNYAYANDNFSMQTLQMANNKNVTISPVYSLEQIVNNYLTPSAQSEGYNLVEIYPLPEVKQFWNRFDYGMLKTSSSRQYNLMGTDWQDGKGKMSFIVLVQTIITNGAFISWTLQTTELEAPQESFKKAKKAFIHGLANTQVNMEWQQLKNKKLLQSIRYDRAKWENATRQSQIAHNQRMRTIESYGNTTRSIGKTYSDILDISHSGYLKRDAINNSGQSKTINMIGGQAVISNMATGERYNVKDGSKYYWVNTNAEYFGTNNSFYDPRTDQRLNNTEWTQFEIEN